MNLFTQREPSQDYQGSESLSPRAQNQVDLLSIFDYVNNFVLDFKKTLILTSQNGERSLDKIIEHLYKQVVEAYIQRLVFLIVARPGKPKMQDMPGGNKDKRDHPFFFTLITHTFKNHLLPKKEKQKKAVSHLQIEQKATLLELGQIIENDAKLFAEFRDSNSKNPEF